MKSLLERLEELQQLPIKDVQDILVSIVTQQEGYQELIAKSTKQELIFHILKYEYREFLGYKVAS